MMQGDSYNIGILILNNAGQPVAPADVLDVEIAVGDLVKSYRAQQLRYYEGLWMFPLSQEESFRMPPYALDAQVRVLWANGALEGKKLEGLRIQESISKEVL